jgi:hypothetical protein
MEADPIFLVIVKYFFKLFSTVRISTCEICKDKLTQLFFSVFAQTKVNKNILLERWAVHNVARLDVSVQD